jgi:hypothetical protein
LRSARLAAIVALATAMAGSARAQDMEPRAYSASPVGVNFLVLIVSRSTGAVVFDPALPITDVRAEINGGALGVGHTFNLFGKLGQASVAVPYAMGEVTGNVREERGRVTRSGLGDSRARLSVNLRGNDAMTPREFAKTPRRTIVGVSFTATMPASQYSGTKLINLGTNRWSVKPELGVSVPWRRLDLDAYAGGWLYFDNPDFYPGGAVRSQDPLLTVQGHVSYTIRRGLWVAGDWTWYHGGSASVDGGAPSLALNNSRAGVTASVPFLRRYSVKVAYGTGLVARTGTNFRTFAVGLQTVWISPRWSGK